MNAWVLLGFAILLEVCATSLLNASRGFSRPLFGVGAILLYWMCFFLLAFAVTRIPVGVAYAIWSGIGIVGIAAIGFFVFRQPLSLAQMGFMALILIGAIGLNLVTRAPAAAA